MNKTKIRQNSYIYLLLACGLVLTLGSFAFLSIGQEPIVPSGVAEIRFGNFSTFDQEGSSNVYIELNDVVAVNSFGFGFVTPLISRDAGSYRVEVFDVETNNLIYFRVIELESDQDYTFLLVGDNDSKPLEAIFLEDSLVEKDPNGAKLRVVHYAQTTPDGGDSELDVRLKDGTVIADNFGYGSVDRDFSVNLTPGQIETEITTTNGQNTLLVPRPAALEAGDLGTYLLVGNIKNETVSVYFFKNESAGGFLSDFGPFTLPPATFSIVNLAIVRSSTEEAPVPLTIELNGEPFLDNVVYGEYSDGFEIEAGEISLDVYRNNKALQLLSASVDLSSGDEFNLVLSGDGGQFPYEITRIEEGVPEDPNVLPRLRFGHLSTFVNSQNGRIDIALDTGQIIADDLEYGSITSPRRTVEGSLSYEIRAWDGSTDYFQFDPISILSQSDQILLLTGDGVREPISFFKIDNGTAEFINAKALASGDASLTFANLSMRQLEASPITLRINGIESPETLLFGGATYAGRLDTGQTFIQAVDSLTGSVLASKLINVNYGSQKNLFLIGDGRFNPYEIVDIDVVPVVNQASSMLQLSNFALVGGAEQVDFVLNGSSIGESDPLSSEEETAGSTILAPGAYELKVYRNGEDEPFIPEHLITLEAGKSVHISTIGNGVEFPYQLYAVVDGSEAEFLDPFDTNNFNFRYNLPIVGNQ